MGRLGREPFDPGFFAVLDQVLAWGADPSMCGVQSQHDDDGRTVERVTPSALT